MLSLDSKSRMYQHLCKSEALAVVSLFGVYENTAHTRSTLKDGMWLPDGRVTYAVHLLNVFKQVCHLHSKRNAVDVDGEICFH